ncbi:hypothetical protein [Endozoicomonas elysicola]|nr:hypothetical protein [Endozoicomonas elysicola]
MENHSLHAIKDKLDESPSRSLLSMPFEYRLERLVIGHMSSTSSQ